MMITSGTMTNRIDQLEQTGLVERVRNAGDKRSVLVGLTQAGREVIEAAVLQAEFSPISDMRASGAYRRQVLGSLLQRYWLESQGQPSVSLDTLTLEAAV